MTDVLVLLEHPLGESLTRTDAERLTLARDLGDAVAVVPGDLGAAAREDLARLGVTRAVELTLRPGIEPAPQVAHALAELMGRRQAVAAVLAPADGTGAEVAARVSVRTGSGLIGNATDARALSHGIVASQVVFGGRYRVESVTTTGTPVLTVRAGAAQVREFGPVDVEVVPLGEVPGEPRPAPRIVDEG